MSVTLYHFVKSNFLTCGCAVRFHDKSFDFTSSFLSPDSGKRRNAQLDKEMTGERMEESRAVKVEVEGRKMRSGKKKAQVAGSNGTFVYFPLELRFMPFPMAI